MLKITSHVPRLFSTLALVAAFAGSLASCSSNSTTTETVMTKERSASDMARDAYRHPVATLDFFDVQEGMSVVEITPGGGWYTEVIAERMKTGDLYLAIFSDQSKRSYAARLNQKLRQKVELNKDNYPNIHYTVFESPDTLGPIAPDNSVDRVLTFRNVHSWMSDRSEQAAFESFYKALKPGGILGVVEHRANTDKPQDPDADSGYVREDYVTGLALAAGFILVASSDINDNPLDTADHPKGVWTLAPSLRLKDKDREKYLAIGESDRMTLKFIKPVK